MRNVFPDLSVNIAAGVAGVEDPLAVGADRHRVQRVVVVDALEAREQHLALVHGRIEPQVAIDVRVDDEVGRLRDDDLVVDDGDAERRDERRFLHERVRAVGLAVAVGVLQHDDAIAFGLAGVMRAVANAFGHPDAAVVVDVDVGRVAAAAATRPTRVTSKPSGTWKRSSGSWIGWPGAAWPARALGGGLACLEARAERLLWRDGQQHQHKHYGQRREERIDA